VAAWYSLYRIDEPPPRENADDAAGVPAGA
jgi:hypothetical protein